MLHKSMLLQTSLFCSMFTQSWYSSRRRDSTSQTQREGGVGTSVTGIRPRLCPVISTKTIQSNTSWCLSIHLSLRLKNNHGSDCMWSDMMGVHSVRRIRLPSYPRCPHHIIASSIYHLTKHVCMKTYISFLRDKHNGVVMNYFQAIIEPMFQASLSM